MVIVFILLYLLIGFSLYLIEREVEPCTYGIIGLLLITIFWPAICIGSILIVIAKTLLKW